MQIIAIAIMQSDLVELSAHRFYWVALCENSAGTFPKINIYYRSVTILSCENGDSQAGLQLHSA